MNNIELKQHLTSHELALVESEKNQHMRTTLTAYVLFLFLAGIGAHQFYLRNKGKGFLFIFGIPLGLFFAFQSTAAREAGDTSASQTLLVIGSLLLIAPVFMWFADLFTMSSQVEKANLIKEREIIQQVNPQTKAA